MPQSEIRWKRGDYIRLGQAVAKFNKTKKEIETEENRLYLPEDLSYKNLKETITTRQELNRQLKLLREFNQDNSKLVLNSVGQKVTEWEFEKLLKEQKRAERVIEKQLTAYTEKRQPYKSEAQITLEAQLKNIKKLQTTRGYNFEKIKNRISKLGSTDFEMRKAIIYKDNYLNVLKRYENFDNYDLLKEKLSHYQNPIKFYELMQKGELLVDLTYQSEQYYSQENFNRFLVDLGISEDLIIESEIT